MGNLTIKSMGLPINQMSHLTELTRARSTALHTPGQTHRERRQDAQEEERSDAVPQGTRTRPWGSSERANLTFQHQTLQHTSPNTTGARTLRGHM